MAISNNESGSSVRTKINASLALTDAITASAAELNILDGATFTTTELNYVDGVTSAIQTQLDAKLAISAAAGGEVSGTLANIALLNSAVLAKVLTGLNTTGSTIASTDTLIQAFGKLQNQINGLLGGAIYQGTWNATTNSPRLVSATGTQGYYYVVSVAGSTNLDGVTDWKVGDWAIYNGTAWQKVDNTDAVSSVNGYTGAVSLTSADISEVTNLYFTTARVLATAITGFSAGAGTVAATDTILQAINKIVGNIAAKQDTLVSATNIKTINGNSILGSGDLTVSGSGTTQVVAATLGSTQTNYAISGLSTSSGTPTILYVTPSTSFSFQSLNLTGVEDGKTIIIINSSVYNASAARAFIIENNNGASGTKFLYANNGVPMIMTPGGMSRFIYTGGYLRLENSTCFGDSPNACFDYFDDLLWTPVTSGSLLPAWKFGSSGTSSIATNTSFTIPTDINPMGVLGISTGSASAIGSLLLQQQAIFQGGRGFATFLGRGTPATTLSTGSDTWFDFMGFMNGDGASITNGVYWKYDAATVTNWFPATNLNGTEATITGQGPTANVDQMPYLGIFINGNWTNVEYFYSTDGITWTWCATAITTQIPTASDRLFSVGASRRRTAGTAARILAIDILAYTYKALRTT